MQTITETVQYFKSVGEMIKGSASAFERKSEPFCMWSWLTKDGKPYDLALVGYNPAFKKKVNDKATLGVTLSDIAPSVVDFWIEKFWPLENKLREVSVENYVTSGSSRKFNLIVAYQTELLGQRGIAMVFFDEPVKCVVDLPESLVKDAEEYNIDIQKTVEDYLKTLRGTYP